METKFLFGVARFIMKSKPSLITQREFVSFQMSEFWSAGRERIKSPILSSRTKRVILLRPPFIELRLSAISLQSQGGPAKGVTLLRDSIVIPEGGLYLVCVDSLRCVRKEELAPFVGVDEACKKGDVGFF
ncbi:MAG: hypothetical protein KDD61_06760 [Bdellovibrionales bacterium]|nr:hypothetical protein [Bdellovibrionales bacterium]